MGKMIEIIDKLKTLCNPWQEQFTVWYGGLDDLSRFGIIAVAIVAVFCILVACVLSRATNR